MKRLGFGLTLLALACAAGAGAQDLPDRAPGANLLLQTPITFADGLELIVSDVVIPPDGTVARHCHPGQEILVMVEGTSVHVVEGQPERVLVAGDSVVIPAGAIHAPRGGPDGARAITFRVFVEGLPERVAVPEGNDNSACLVPESAH